MRYIGKQSSADFGSSISEGSSVRSAITRQNRVRLLTLTPWCSHIKGKLIAVALSVAFLMDIPAVSGIVIWSLITIWTQVENQPW